MGTSLLAFSPQRWFRRPKIAQIFRVREEAAAESANFLGFSPLS
jgi:hypothetical protein